MAPRASSRPVSVAYRVQRYHGSLRLGEVLTVEGRRKDPVELHLRQSELDAACGIHCVAMCLIALGLVKRSAILAMGQRSHGLAAHMYRLFEGSWRNGIYPEQVVDALQALGLPITVRAVHGFDNGVDRFAADRLERAELTLLAYESVRDRHRHYLLAVGCGGLKRGQTLTIDSLLVLDPSADAIPMSCCNAALVLNKPISFARRKRSVQWRYVGPYGSENVRLMSAISIASRDP